MIRLKNFINDKNGAGAIEQTIILFIFVILFCFVYDIILVAYRQFAISEASNKVVRLIAVQGGVTRTVPKGYQDEAGVTYKHADDIVKSLESYLLSLDSNLQHVYITNEKTGYTVDLCEDIADIKVDYKQKFEMKIEYTYNWDLTGNVIPVAHDVQGIVERYSVGEFDYDI